MAARRNVPIDAKEVIDDSAERENLNSSFDHFLSELHEICTHINNVYWLVVVFFIHSKIYKIIYIQIL